MNTSVQGANGYAPIFSSKDKHQEDVESKRKRIVRSGRLHWVHWSVICLSFMITLIAWGFSSSQVERNGLAQFDHAATQIIESVTERMQKYEGGLWGGVAAIASHDGDISRSDWEKYAATLHIAQKYPGINGIGVIHNIQPDQLETYLARQRETYPSFDVFPKHEHADLFPITYIEPVSINAPAIGLDIAHETNRYKAATLARETGQAQITGPIILVQDSAKTPGFLFYTPFYALGREFAPNVGDNDFIGLVYAPFIFHKLIAGTLEKSNRQLYFRVRDGDQTLYSEMDDHHTDLQKDDIFTKSVELNLYGRTWVFDIWAGPEFRKNMSSNNPLVILLSGILIEIILFILFILLSRSNIRALSFAEMVSDELRQKANELGRSNADLEKFAYITSHDLKTPLRGMADLTEYVEEDLSTYLNSPDANPDVAFNLDRMRTQIQRMENLIKGILAYSGVDKNNTTNETVDLNVLVRRIQVDLSLTPRQVQIVNPLPILETNQTRLTQVMTNLIGNAAKYHCDIENAEILISSQDLGDMVQIIVSDNGPGIDRRFHSKVFEPFQSLQSKDKIESTGIGLSIVKRTVEFYGGNLRIDSDLGRGTSMIFTWPK
ncbi:histidine kinase/DNA gyrase B/HSP90-like ATPase [Pacificibacter maritimus]|uniref:histidine kinase n=1 Tax=Pacificibacter maritimus TaxID=762213 RepID=A0A3N4U6N5_9RHOB|nr:CHASE domain-containing protein [Pacificibacter maritimus]RPE66433.1 histidine kinase/DNA gyrase B/HSP90-like ATPase [Pacificibacter maritimus]